MGEQERHQQKSLKRVTDEGQRQCACCWLPRKQVEAGEAIKAHLEGWIGEMMGSGRNTQRDGQFVLTNERACFYRKGFLGEVFETIPLSKITVVPHRVV
ncbi:hypothetical protein [Mesorhizobium sp.]|uniref:hypothetical protein n=1 Tax=Mesorhizobium sp. TaxID=1871066 RepID=UPI0025E3FF08|nr:hypothetical protein [Mesorhizobium sp.]